MDEREDDEIDLLEILELIKKNIVLFLVIMILCGGAGFCISKFVLEEQFTATAKLIIVKDDSSSSTTVTYSDVQLSQKLASTYAQIILSEAISDDVINELDLDSKYEIDQEKYEKIVSVEALDSTEVMAISVETNNPKLSALIANEIVSVFIEKLPSIMKVENTSVLSYAKVPEKKSGPSNTINTAIGLAVGMVICGLITLIKYFKDVTIKTEEEVKKIFDYPVLSTIPDLDLKEEDND